MREAPRAASHLFIDGAFDNIFFTLPLLEAHPATGDAFISGEQGLAVTV